MIVFTGQTEKTGHFLQPTAIAMGHSVMEALEIGTDADAHCAPIPAAGGDLVFGIR